MRIFFGHVFFSTSFALYFQVVVDLEVLGRQTLSISGWLLRQVLGAEKKKNTSPLELPQMVICHIGPSNPSRRIRIRVKHQDQNIQTNDYHFLKRSWGPHVNLISKTGSFLYKIIFGAKCTKTRGDHMIDKWIIMAPKPSLTSTPVDPSCCWTHCGKFPEPRTISDISKVLGDLADLSNG